MWKLIALLGVLQGLDCLTTWAAGIEREGNSFAVQVWENQGFGTIAFCKMAIVAGLALEGYVLKRVARLNVFPSSGMKLLERVFAWGVGAFCTGMLLIVSWNFFALAVNPPHDAWF